MPYAFKTSRFWFVLSWFDIFDFVNVSGGCDNFVQKGGFERGWGNVMCRPFQDLYALAYVNMQHICVPGNFDTHFLYCASFKPASNK